jgi:hypothetical protein
VLFVAELTVKLERHKPYAGAAFVMVRPVIVIDVMDVTDGTTVAVVTIVMSSDLISLRAL